MPSPLCLSSLYLCTPQAKQCSEYHITQKEQSETHKPASTYTWSLKRTRVNGTCPSIWKRKTGTHQTNQPTNQTKKFSTKKEMYFCLFTFWCISHRYSAKWFLSFKKIWRKIAIYIRLLAQGVKFTDFFKLEKHTQKKATSGVFYLSTLLLCFP